VDLLLQGKRVRVTDRDLLGQGGEADVYRLGDLALKIFRAPDAAKLAKVRAFPRDLPAAVIAPLDVVQSTHGADVGYAMPAVEGAFEIRRLAERAFRAGPIDGNAVLRVLGALGGVVDALHARRVVVGDLNEGNVLVDPSPARTRALLIDADSFHLPGHPCTVAHERFLDPRLYGRDLAAGFDVESDRYALAVILFQSLLFVHPYGGVHPAHPTLLRRAEARCSALDPAVKLPRAAASPAVLPDALRDWLARVFERGERPHLAEAHLDQVRFTRCGCGVEHARTRCPACSIQIAIHAPTLPAIVRRGRCVVRRVLEARGPLLAFAAQRGPAWVVEEEAGLRREDGSLVGVRAVPALARLAIGGRTTWIAVGEVAVGWRDGREIARLACTTGPLGAAFDASEHGAYRVHGDHVVDDQGRRLAACPGGLSWLRVGARLGLVIYRVGRAARAVVFRTGESPDAGGRDVALPPSVFGDAKVVALDATFDDRHVLLGVELERAGKVERATLLLDERGALLAQAHGAANAGPLLGGAGTRALANGRVIAAASDGLALFEADAATRSFVERARFPDAAPFVGPDDALVAAPGGALFVVGPSTVDELTLS
jgi:H/ACA ribonucleoprotein complex subunit 3